MSMKFIMRALGNALGLWAAIFVVPGVTMLSNAYGKPGYALYLIILGACLALLNIVLKPIVKLLTLPLYLLTLGLWSIIVNGFILVLAGNLAGSFGYGLHFDKWWQAGLAAVIVAVISGIFNFMFAPKDNDRGHKPGGGPKIIQGRITN